MSWFKFHILFRLAVRYNWNYSTTYKGRFWSNRRGYDWRKNRIYLSGDANFSPFSGGGYTEVTGLVPPDSEANTDSSNSPTEATQEEKEPHDS